MLPDASPVDNTTTGPSEESGNAGSESTAGVALDDMFNDDDDDEFSSSAPDTKQEPLQTSEPE